MKYPGRFVLAIILGVAIVAGMQLYKYNNAKKATTDGMINSAGSPSQNMTHASADGEKEASGCGNTNGDYTAANPLGQNSDYAAASGMTSGADGLPSSCSQGNIANPADLLPASSDSDQWAQLNPSGNGSLGGVNLLNAGSFIGVDTVSTSLRNANLQVRSEPPNPQVNVGPWNNTTISPELSRRPLEIGCGPL